MLPLQDGQMAAGDLQNPTTKSNNSKRIKANQDIAKRIKARSSNGRARGCKPRNAQNNPKEARQHADDCEARQIHPCEADPSESRFVRHQKREQNN